MNSLDILAQLYTILSQASSSDLRDAARQVQSQKRLYSALMSLSNERQHYERRISTESRQSARQSEEIADFDFQPIARPTRLMKYVSDLFNSEMNNDELAHLLNTIDLGIRFHKSDGRPRMMRKIERITREMPHKEIDELIEELDELTRRSQTQGWFHVIKNHGRQ